MWQIFLNNEHWLVKEKSWNKLKFLKPYICSCRWDPAPSPQGWSKSRASWSSSSGKWLHLVVRAPPAHSSDTVHQICLPAHQWTAGAPLPYAHLVPSHSGGYRELLVEAWLMGLVEKILSKVIKRRQVKKTIWWNVLSHHPIFRSGCIAQRLQRLVCGSLLVQWGHQGNLASCGPPPQDSLHIDRAPRLTHRWGLYASRL